MGHANLSNISVFFRDRLYARGTLSVSQAVQELRHAGEKLHASEADYDDESMLEVGIEHLVRYLTSIDPSRSGYTGPEGGGPWIGPWLEAKLPPSLRPSPEANSLLRACEKYPGESDRFLIAADKLFDECLDDWSEYIRILPELRRVHAMWGDANRWFLATDDDYRLFDAIRWRFVNGWRKRFKDIPLLANVSN